MYLTDFEPFMDFELWGTYLLWVSARPVCASAGSLAWRVNRPASKPVRTYATKYIMLQNYAIPFSTSARILTHLTFICPIWLKNSGKIPSCLRLPCLPLLNITMIHAALKLNTFCKKHCYNPPANYVIYQRVALCTRVNP